MIKINKSDLEAVAVKPSQYPEPNLKEIAFAGRSNVGKSSLLNLLTGRKSLARVSGNPGKTRTINFYIINDEFRIVDLPGYGYAKVSKSVSSDWGPMMEKYLSSRENLIKVIQLVDIRHAPSRQDVQMYEYLKYYGRRLSGELEQMFDCHVHIYRGCAFLMAGEDLRMGAVFPGSNSISDILLLCFEEIRKKIESGKWQTGPDEMCYVDRIEFENMIHEVKRKYGSGFSKMFREMPEGEFARSVLEEMKLWMAARSETGADQIVICPIVGKMQGNYPEDYTGGMNK